MKAKPLFIMGNKRSGTSLLTEILNMHPEVYVSYESDVIWLTYQRMVGKEFVHYPYDSAEGMDNSLLYLTDALKEEITDVESRFYELQHIIKDNTAWAKHKVWDNLKYIGDKKPGQHADPVLCNFIATNFKEPRFLHIIRHPKSSVYSMRTKGERGFKGAPDFWSMPVDQILKYWVKFEQWVLEAKKKHTVFTIRFEDLISSPMVICKCIFDFLKLDVPQSEIYKKGFNNPNSKYADKPLEITKEAKEIMEVYEYRE